MAFVATIPAVQPVTGQTPLSLEEAVAEARNRSPILRIQRNEVQTADWDLRAARGQLLPSATVSSGVRWQGAGEQQIGSLTGGELGFGDQPSYWFSNYSLGLNYTLSGSTLIAPRQRQASREAGVARTRDVERQVAFDVTRAYLELLRQQEGVVLARSQLERAEANLRLVRGRTELGAATILEVRQAEVQVGRAEVSLLQAEQGVRTARISLLQRMGAETDREVVPITRFEVDGVRWDEEGLFLMALDESPALEALRVNREVARMEVNSARSAYLPTLSVQARWSGFTRQASQDDFLLRQVERRANQLVSQCEFQNDLFRRLAEPIPAQDCGEFQLTEAQRRAALDENRVFPFDFTRSAPEVGLTLSLPVFQGFNRQRQVEAARIQEDNAAERIRERELAIRADISSLLAQLHTAVLTEEIEGRNREVAADQLRLAREQYGLGTVSFLELAEAEAGVAQADRDHVESIFRYHEALAQLEFVVGIPLGVRRTER